MDHKPLCMKEELKDDTERFCACNDCDPRPMKKKVTTEILENPCAEVLTKYELPELAFADSFAVFLADFKARDSQ